MLYNLCWVTLHTHVSCPSCREAWTSGIWAWDCVIKERVLVIPFVAALLGDNPMQSEFACHLGQGGNHFCRMCEVGKGADSASGECQHQINHKILSALQIH
jgi:hypothetical protein